MRAFRRSWGVVGAALFVMLVAACGEKKKPIPPTPPPDRPAAPKPQPVEPVPEEPAAQRDPSLPPLTFTDDASLIKALRAGGYVIAIRHAKTDMNQKDTQGDDYADCAKQRNLTDEGRADAKALGEAFKAMKVPVAEVLTSPYCRCKETAELAFGKFTIDTRCMGEDQASIDARATLLGAKPPAGQNVVIVTHQNSMGKSTGTDVPYYNEGGALLIVPKGGTEFEMGHTIVFEDWARLAQVAKGME